MGYKCSDINGKIILEDVCSWVVGGNEYFFGSLHKNRNALYEPTRNELLQEDISKIHNPHERVYSNIYSNTCKYEKLSSASNTTSNVSSIQCYKYGRNVC